MRAILAGIFTIGAAIGALCSWLAAAHQASRATNAEWRAGYLAGYRVGREAETYERCEQWSE